MADGPCNIIINTGGGGNDAVYAAFQGAAGLVLAKMYPDAAWADSVAALENDYLAKRKVLDGIFLSRMQAFFDQAEAQPLALASPPARTG